MLDIKVAAKAHNEKSARRNWRQLCDPDLSFDEPFFNDLIALWRSKLGSAQIPKRSAITIRELKPFLTNIAIMERIKENPSQYRWKLVGTKVAQVLGEHTGKLLEDGITHEQLSRLSESFDMVLEAGQPWRFYGEVTLNGRDYLIAENLYLPLADEDGKARFIMALCRYASASTEREDLRERIENAMLSEPRGLL